MPVGKYQRSEAELTRLRNINPNQRGKTYEQIYGTEKANLIRLKKSNSNNPRWNGGRFKLNGYVYVLRPEHPCSNNNGYIAEHRLVMEAHLGRYLKPDEIVHHKNRNRIDNRLENLELTDSHKHFFEHMADINVATKEQRKKAAEYRIRKPNNDGEFFCHLCNQWKVKTDFPKQKRNIFGVGSYCKSCNNIHFNSKRNILEVVNHD